MPTKRRFMDANSGDYEIENGAPRSDDSLGSMVAFRVRHQRGSSPSEPNIGSRIHEVKSTNSFGLRLIETYAVECVKDMVDRKLIKDVTSEAIKYTGGLVRIILTFRDKYNTTRPITVDKQVGVD